MCDDMDDVADDMDGVAYIWVWMDVMDDDMDDDMDDVSVFC